MKISRLRTKRMSTRSPMVATIYSNEPLVQRTTSLRPMEIKAMRDAYKNAALFLLFVVMFVGLGFMIAAAFMLSDQEAVQLLIDLGLR